MKTHQTHCICDNEHCFIPHNQHTCERVLENILRNLPGALDYRKNTFMPSLSQKLHNKVQIVILHTDCGNSTVGTTQGSQTTHALWNLASY